MIPIGVGIVFVAYTTGIWGYCLVRGYNVKFTQLFATAWPAAKQKAAADAAAAAVTGALGTPPPRSGAGPAPSRAPAGPAG